MRELSLHILDIVQNSIAAEATVIEVFINEDLKRDLLIIRIKDNGSGIEKEKLNKITDPYVTSRTTRKVGLGLSLFKEAARRCEGELEIESTPSQGTEVSVFLKYSHIDRAPLGDLPGTLISLIALNPEIDFKYRHLFQEKEFIVDTTEVKEELEGIEINQREVLNWIKEFFEEGLEELYGGD